MDRITLKQLRYFDAVARYRHFGQAAAACAISQPALSMQIKELEQEFGTPLFDRQSRQIRLTGCGEHVWDRVQPIIRSVDELGEFARIAGETMMGRLRIGIIPTVAPYILPDTMKQLALVHPQLDVHVREAVTPALLDELGSGAIDAAILALPAFEPKLTEVFLFKEDFVLVRPIEHADDPIPDRGDISDSRLLLLEEGHCFRDQVLDFWGLQTPISNNVIETGSLTTLIQMVAAGMGITLLPKMAIPVEIASQAVSVAPFENNPPSRVIGMVWRKSSPLALQLLELSEVIRNGLRIDEG